jgi:hypothetical protein
MQAHEPVFAEDARFLVEHTDRIPRFALPSPFLIAVRYGREGYMRDTPGNGKLSFRLLRIGATPRRPNKLQLRQSCLTALPASPRLLRPDKLSRPNPATLSRSMTALQLDSWTN